MNETKEMNGIDPHDSDAIVAMELAALERWCKGDPSGFLEISAPDVAYFDPFLERRLDGLAALTRYYEGLRGKVSAPRHEMVAPLVQRIGDAAVLSYNFNSWGGNENAYRWHCTEVYRRSGETWRIVHTHWSLVQPDAA